MLWWQHVKRCFHISATEVISATSYFKAIERVRNYANVTCWVRMARHVIVNLFRPFPKRILFHFKREPPPDIKSFNCKTISHWNILFHAEIISFQHLSTTLHANHLSNICVLQWSSAVEIGLRCYASSEENWKRKFFYANEINAIRGTELHCIPTDSLWEPHCPQHRVLTFALVAVNLQL